jgi:ankyrin repeat protein
LNIKNENGYYLIERAVKYDSIEIVNLLIGYANQHHILLDLNERNNCGNYPLLKAVKNRNYLMVDLLIDYSNEHQITLKMNNKDNDNFYPLLSASSNYCGNLYYNSPIFELLISYATQHHIILELNEQDEWRENFPLLSIISFVDNIDMIELLIEYANEHHVILDLNKQDKKRKYPLLKAIQKNNNVDVVKLLIQYANQHHIILELNKNDKYGDYPLLVAIKNDNSTEIVKLLIEYANQHNITLELNRKNHSGKYPLARAIKYNNTEIVKLLMEYSNQNHISLELNNKDNDRYYPLTRAIKNKNEDIVKLLIEYAKQHQIFLKYNKFYIKRNSEISILIQNYENGYEEMIMNEIERTASRENLEREITEIENSKNESLENSKNEIELDRLLCKERVLRNGITPEYLISFEERVNQLRSLYEMSIIDIRLDLDINRNNLFEDAYYGIMYKSPERLKRQIIINYIGEEGLDYGGLLKDFFYQISKVIGNPNYSLFKYSNNDSYELEINPYSSEVYLNYLDYYKFIGRIIGLAIFNKLHLPIPFTLLFYKRLLNKSVESSDLEYYDPQMFKNLQFLKNVHEVENLNLTFSKDVKDCFGNRKTIELKPDGAKINVTDSNKDEYINLMIQNKLNGSNDKNQFDALKQGFYDIIPQNINSILDEIDLKYLVFGTNIIDVDDWENNTDYDGYEKNDETIINFWKCVREFSNEDRIKLLVFATGNSQVPVTGFKDLQNSDGIQHFKLKKTGEEEDLPTSHTCFNRIDLPPYTSYTKMRQKLLLSISEGVGSFIMA